MKGTYDDGNMSHNENESMQSIFQPMMMQVVECVFVMEHLFVPIDIAEVVQ